MIKARQDGWEEATRTLVPWRQEFMPPTMNECMGWFAQIKEDGLPVITSMSKLHQC